MIVVFGLVLAEIAMVYFSLVSSNTNQANYKNMATHLADTVALTIDIEDTKAVTNAVVSYYESSSKPGRDKEGTQEYKDYLAQFDAVKAMPEYKRLQSYLSRVKEANPETDGVYLAYVDYERKSALYIVYDQENEVFPVGVIDPLYEEDYPMLKDHMLGFVASIYIDEATDMHLVTAGRPVLDNENNIICYALVDITMDTVRSKQADAIVRLFIYLVITVLVISVLGVVIVHFTLIRPVKALQHAAMSYDVNDPDGTHEAFAKLKVGTHDEFTDLADAMKVMEGDVNRKIHELTETNATLLATQKVAGKMAELANKDALTGVRNKIAYDTQVAVLNDRIRRKEETIFGLAMVDLNYLKNINDDYGHESGDHALIKLCNIICTIFGHSPVYRVGGDEFVILFRGPDYERSAELIAEFNAKIEDLSADKDLLPEEQVSAAIGYAEFDPEHDTSVDDVFNRADKAMYVRKKEMKANDEYR